MIHYRSFRNTDPPALASLWTACFTQRGAVTLNQSMLLEHFVLAKPYFDPASLTVAVTDSEELVGFILSGFGPSSDRKQIDRSTGVICLLGVHPNHQRQGIATELLRLSETFLLAKGAQEILAGALAPYNPYPFGLYGGSSSPGFLDSDPLAALFFLKRGFRPIRSSLVLQRSLVSSVAVGDGRFAAFRQNLEIIGSPIHKAGFWQECVVGPVEVYNYSLRERKTKRVLAFSNLWQMEFFGIRWKEQAIGILDLQVNADHRRQGLGRFLVTQILRHLQEQFFTIAEIQVEETNLPALGMLKGLGFQLVDRGQQFRKV